MHTLCVFRFMYKSSDLSCIHILGFDAHVFVCVVVCESMGTSSPSLTSRIN